MVPTEDLTVAVRKQLDRLLADGIFDGQERQKQFLRFVVEETLAGRGSELKEMLIGVVVFGRGDGYDPRLDATVRVEATKLRKRLAEYYNGRGANDRVVLTIPKGGYVPQWISRDTAPISAPVVPKTLRRFKKEIVMATIAFVVLMAAYAFYKRPQPTPRTPKLTRVTHDNGVAVTPAISRNGDLLAYASDRRGAKNLNLWVRPLAGGEPIQITDMPGDEHSPSFSSDGEQIVFQYHSMNGDSLYSVPTLGGRSPQLLVAQGSAPRFSPTGNVLAFNVARGDLGPHQVGAGVTFLMDPGGQPRQLCPFLQTALSAVWSPDGKKILFLGYDGEKDYLDWYVTPVAKCAPVPSGFAALFKTIDPPDDKEMPWARTISSVPPLIWQNRQVVFQKEAGGIMQLWTVGIDSDSGKVEGPAKLVTGGTAASRQPASGPSGVLAFCVRNSNIDLFSVGFSAETGKVAGDLLRLTEHPAADFSPSLTGDGRWLAFASNRTGSQSVWLKDMVSGNEKSLTPRGQQTNNPIIDPLGRWVEYQLLGLPAEYYRRDAFRMNLDGSEQHVLHERLYSLGETASGEHRILVDSDRTVHVWDRKSRTMRPLALPEKPGEVSHILSARFTPDEKWAALDIRVVSDRQIILIPFIPGRTVERSDLTEITKREDRAQAPVWSPAGRMLYYLSDRNEDTRIMAVQIENGKPKGEHQLVFRLDEPERKLLPMAFSVAANRLVFTVMQTKSEIWLQR